jgi:hypothetical protein
MAVCGIAPTGTVWVDLAGRKERCSIRVLWTQGPSGASLPWLLVLRIGLVLQGLSSAVASGITG